MIKSTILLAVSLLGFLAAPLAVRQESVIKTPVQVVPDAPPVSLDVPFSLPQTTKDVVVSVPKAKASRTVTKVKQFVCGDFQESSLGGSYRTCEWK